MILAIADTHVVVWYMQEPERLSPGASAEFERSKKSRNTYIGVSPMTLVEMIYLRDRGTMDEDALRLVKNALTDRKGILRPVPITVKIAISMAEIPRMAVPDMPDRVISATALSMGVPLITRDEKIRASKVRTIW